MSFILVALLTNTTLGTYSTQAQCQSAVRQIYEQKMDPYHTIPVADKTRLLKIVMQYEAPKKYVCVKN